MDSLLWMQFPLNLIPLPPFAPNLTVILFGTKTFGYGLSIPWYLGIFTNVMKLCSVYLRSPYKLGLLCFYENIFIQYCFKKYIPAISRTYGDSYKVGLYRDYDILQRYLKDRMQSYFTPGRRYLVGIFSIFPFLYIRDWQFLPDFFIRPSVVN